jgi:hypothetical protein
MTIFRVPVKITYPGDGGPGMNVWHVRTIGPDGMSDDEQLGEAVEALRVFYDAIKPYYPTGTTIVGGESIIRDPLGSPEYQDDVRWQVAGTASGEMMPPYCAMVCAWRTTSATRSGRGRTFLGPFTETFNGTNGVPSVGNVTSLKGHAQTLINASTGPSGWSLGVLSVKQGVLRDIIGVSVANRWSYLSSRRD